MGIHTWNIPPSHTMRTLLAGRKKKMVHTRRAAGIPHISILCICTQAYMPDIHDSPTRRRVCTWCIVAEEVLNTWHSEDYPAHIGHANDIHSSISHICYSSMYDNRHRFKCRLH